MISIEKEIKLATNVLDFDWEKYPASRLFTLEFSIYVENFIIILITFWLDMFYCIYYWFLVIEKEVDLDPVL